MPLVSMLLYNGLRIYRLGNCQWDTSRGEEINGAPLTPKKPPKSKKRRNCKQGVNSYQGLSSKTQMMTTSLRQTAHTNELMQSKANLKHPCGRFGRGSRMQLNYFLFLRGTEPLGDMQSTFRVTRRVSWT